MKTPVILLNSGIGNKTEIRALGIKSLVDLPEVGQNLADHVLFGTAWQVNSTDTFDDYSRNATIQAEDLNEWRTTGQGLLVDNPVSHIGWIRLPANHSVFETTPDPTAGPHSPHYEILFWVSLLRLMP